jgi:hypothetical protein|nr:MAG TPA: hypothetical protein [Caudoviricetes sp.]
MSYNKKGYYLRARLIKEITKLYYEPENQSKCYKQVWKKHIRDRFGICYRSYLNYLKAEEPKEEPPGKTLQLSLF